MTGRPSAPPNAAAAEPDHNAWNNEYVPVRILKAATLDNDQDRTSGTPSQAAPSRRIKLHGIIQVAT